MIWTRNRSGAVAASDQYMVHAPPLHAFPRALLASRPFPLRGGASCWPAGYGVAMVRLRLLRYSHVAYLAMHVMAGQALSGIIVYLFRIASQPA